MATANISNIRPAEAVEGPSMMADLETDDGRQGTVAVTLAVFEEQGEAALQAVADKLVAEAELG